MLKRWSGVIALEGVETRDHRMIDEFVWNDADLPMNFSAQFVRADAHDGADTTTARMDTITRVGNQILASGVFMDNPSGLKATQLVEAGALRAVSVTGGEYTNYREELLDQNGNLVTDAQFMDMTPDQQAMCRIRRRMGTLEIAGLTLVDVSAFAGARIAVMADDGMTTARLAASAGAAVGHNPDWFKKLKFSGPTRMMITADRRIFGHIADRGQCHRSIEGRCVNIDFDGDDLKDFHNGTALLSDGSIISAKCVTFGDLHAPDGAFSYAEIQHLIENTGAQFGVVRAYPDEFGMQVCGVAFSDVTEAELDRIRAGTPSVDARRKRGNMKLFGIHVVNTGGLPVETDEDQDGVILRMVASAAVGLPEFDASVPLELAADASLDRITDPCDCEGGDEITVPELAEPEPVDLALAVDLAAVSDITRDLSVTMAMSGLDQ